MRQIVGLLGQQSKNRTDQQSLLDTSIIVGVLGLGRVPQRVHSDPPRDATLPPGYDEETPYAEEDLTTYPTWWRRNIEEFRKYDMRPYRPPQLRDGTISPPFIQDLEETYDVDIRFQSTEPESGQWELVIDGESIRSIAHERDGGGYSIFGITADELTDIVRDVAYRST